MVNTRDGMEIVLLCSHTPPRPALRACPCQHFLPKFLHHTQTGDTTGKRPKKLEWLFPWTQSP